MEVANIVERHKQERKELREHIVRIKNETPKTDKKKKREASAKIALLESQLDEKHENELKVNNESIKMANQTDETFKVKTSKAQRRKDKKEAEERERMQRIADGEKTNVNHEKKTEDSELAKQLEDRELSLVEIRPDGNCLFNAITLQLHGSMNNEERMLALRAQTADFMLRNSQQFLPFTISDVTGDVMDADEFAKYCDDLKSTNSWGGQVELNSISQILQRPIEVFQSSTEPLVVGKEFQGKPIRLSYHRHQYGLGEHYNAIVDQSK